MPGELIPIVLFISAAAVMIFRPLTTRLGRSIERSREKRSLAEEPQIQRLMQLMERLVDRMDRLEDRVDFNERMLERQRARGALSGGTGTNDAREARHTRTDDVDTRSRG